jgi:hypothetical protein
VGLIIFILPFLTYMNWNASKKVHRLAGLDSRLLVTAKGTVFRLFPPRADRLCPAFCPMYKVHPRTDHEGPKREYRYNPTLPLTSALDGGGWSTRRAGRFTAGKFPVPMG